MIWFIGISIVIIICGLVPTIPDNSCSQEEIKLMSFEE